MSGKEPLVGNDSNETLISFAHEQLIFIVCSCNFCLSVPSKLGCYEIKTNQNKQLLLNKNFAILAGSSY